MNKKKNHFTRPDGLVYSTDPDFKIPGKDGREMETPVSSLQNLRISLDTRNRAGKAVTLVQGFTGRETDREELGKKLKAFCGTGGSVKDGEIIIQGDNRDKVLQWLKKNGFTEAKKL